MRMTYTILLNDINKVKEFVNTVNTLDFEIDLISGRYVIDAKSIMGIFSLDLNGPIQLIPHTEDPEDMQKLETILKPFIIE